jgi:hypothetical protein
MAARSGEAEWQGDLSSGSGRLMVGEERWASAYSFNSRFDAVLPGAVATGPATSPEELLAAAHAACFSMALSLALTEHGEAPRTEKRRARSTRWRVSTCGWSADCRRSNGSIWKLGRTYLTSTRLASRRGVKKRNPAAFCPGRSAGSRRSICSPRCGDGGRYLSLIERLAPAPG